MVFNFIVDRDYENISTMKFFRFTHNVRYMYYMYMNQKHNKYQYYMYLVYMYTTRLLKNTRYLILIISKYLHLQMLT